MGEGVTIDAGMQAALARLTDNEKECLRRRLQQQTAKEMALELGVSPHAVEKRLKMARTKLGLSSSLEAARLLAASEGYQRAVPRASDLAAHRSARQHRLRRQLMWGVPLVILATAALALLLQTPPGADRASAPSEEPMQPGERRMLTEADMVPATPEEVRAFAEMIFAQRDKDGSGFVERDEVSEKDVQYTDARWEGPGRPTREWMRQQEFRPLPVEPDMARAAAIAKEDFNADGRVSFDEYWQRMEPDITRDGVPKRWREQHRSQG